MSETPEKRITLVDAINQLGTLVSAVESIQENENNEDNVDAAIEALMPQITDGVKVFKEKVDARIFVIENAAMLADKIKKDVEHLKKKISILENVQKRVKEHTKFLIENTPGFEWKGTHKEFVVRKNPKGSINYGFKLDKFENIVDPTIAKEIPEEFLEPVKGFTLKKKEFDDAVKKGAIDSELATYKEPGTHLRIK